MIIEDTTVTKPAPGKLRLVVDFDRLNDQAADGITALASELKKDASDGKVTAAEGVQLIGDTLALVSPGFGGKFALVAPALSEVLADGKITRLEALTLALSMAVAFGS